MVYTAPTIYLTPQAKEKPAWQENLERALTATAAIEAGVLSTMLTLNPFVGAKVAGATALGLGIVKSSAKAREKIVEYGKKTLTGEFGEAIGKQIESFGEPSEKSITESIKEGWEGAGVKGAILGAASGIAAKMKEHPVTTAILGAGGIAAATQIPAVKEKITDVQEWWAKRQQKKDIEEAAQATKLKQEQEAAANLAGLKQVGFTDPVPVGLGGMPVPVSSGIATSGAPQSTQTGKPLYNIIQIAIK